VRAGRNAALTDAANTWRRTWYLRGVTVNGRRFLHKQRGNAASRLK
jgi:hypothetical protein